LKDEGNEEHGGTAFSVGRGQSGNRRETKRGKLARNKKVSKKRSQRVILQREKARAKEKTQKQGLKV